MAIVGIDLGTTNSLVGIIQAGRPKLFRGPDGKSLVPSIVHFPEHGEPEIGSAAKTFQTTEPAQTLYSVKRFMGRGRKDVTDWIRQLPFDFSKSSDSLIRFQVGNRLLNPIDVSSLILKELKQIAEKELGQPVKKAVVTVPAYFNDAQRQATKFAGELAGLEVIRIINEPTAACLAYGLDKKAKGNIVVFDLGGGTFDISCLRVQDGIFEVLATHGDTALGGDDFDHAIAAGLGIGSAHDSVSRAKAIREAERIKCDLTTALETRWGVEIEGKHLEGIVTRGQMETWIAPILARVDDPCRRCLEDAKLRREDITDVLLVGGSSRVPLVRRRVEELFGRLPVASVDPDEVVAVGAAVQAHILEGKTTGMLLLDVIPLSLGIETMGGITSRIIHRNSTVPISASERFSTYVDGQTNVDIHVIQGERELASDNRSLARFQLKGLPPLPAGVPKIEVEFIVDANGILSVRATELRTEKVAAIAVNPSYGLAQDEIEKMLGDAFKHAEADFQRRFLEEAKVEADSIIRATRKSLGAGLALISKTETETIVQSVKNLEQLLASTDHTAIKKGIEILNQVTLPLAERLLNHAVNESLKGKSLTPERKEPHR